MIWIPKWMRHVVFNTVLLMLYLVNVGVGVYYLATKGGGEWIVYVAVWSFCAALGAFNTKCAWDEAHDPMMYAALAWHEFGEKKQ